MVPKFKIVFGKKGTRIYKRDLVKSILNEAGSFGNLEACFFISLIVLLSDFLKGQLSLLCEGNSAESFTKKG